MATIPAVNGMDDRDDSSSFLPDCLLCHRNQSKQPTAALESPTAEKEDTRDDEDHETTKENAVSPTNHVCGVDSLVEMYQNVCTELEITTSGWTTQWDSCGNIASCDYASHSLCQ